MEGAAVESGFRQAEFEGLVEVQQAGGQGRYGPRRRGWDRDFSPLTWQDLLSHPLLSFPHCPCPSQVHIT